MPVAVIELIAQLVSLAIQFEPSVAAAGKLAIDLLRSGRDPTPDEQKLIDDGLDAAERALQGAVQNRTQPGP